MLRLQRLRYVKKKKESHLGDCGKLKMSVRNPRASTEITTQSYNITNKPQEEIQWEGMEGRGWNRVAENFVGWWQI